MTEDRIWTGRERTREEELRRKKIIPPCSREGKRDEEVFLTQVRTGYVSA